MVIDFRMYGNIVNMHIVYSTIRELGSFFLYSTYLNSGMSYIVILLFNILNFKLHCFKFAMQLLLLNVEV